jgi:hypothetical protein
LSFGLTRGEDFRIEPMGTGTEGPEWALFTFRESLGEKCGETGATEGVGVMVEMGGLVVVAGVMVGIVVVEEVVGAVVVTATTAPFDFMTAVAANGAGVRGVDAAEGGGGGVRAESGAAGFARCDGLEGGAERAKLMDEPLDGEGEGV